MTKNFADNIVPISEFNKGKASKIFEQVEKKGPTFVMKHNKQVCVLLPPHGYRALMNMLEDYMDAEEASKRMDNFDESQLIPIEEVMKESGFTEKDLEGWENIEFE